MRLGREKWLFRSLDEVHVAANQVMRFAMFNERSKRWPKVAESYKRLLWMLDKTHFPKDFDPPSNYAVLMYELHYHLGVALQRLDQHRKAIVHYSKAIESVSIPKGGCLAGCVANSCLMTPVLARRAFAYCKTGDMKSALRDAENSVVLDNQNPDVYCIRALVRGSRDEETMAVKDVDAGLKLNPSHVCALIIRGALQRTLAERLNPESQSFYTVTDFNHPCLLDFYDRFLFTLSVPHTITDINLTPDKPSQKQLDSIPDLNLRAPSRASSGHTSSAIREASEALARDAPEPFRCGTPAKGDNRSAARRRKDYGKAVRQHMARPKTAAEFLAQLEKERTRRSQMESSQRAKSANLALSLRQTQSQQSQRISSAPLSSHATRQNQEFPSPPASAYSYRSQGMTSQGVTSHGGMTSLGVTIQDPSSRLSPTSTGVSWRGERLGSASSGRKLTTGPSLDAKTPSERGERVGLTSSGKRVTTGTSFDVETKTPSGRTTKTAATKTFTFETPANYTIPVFQPLNIKGAPRMYYRPWRGDKLPIADVPHPDTAPAFY